MTWAIAFTKTALADIERLDRPLQRRVLAKLDAAQEEPARAFRKLAGRPHHKLRVGDLRVLALLDFRLRRCTVVRVARRSVVYDR